MNIELRDVTEDDLDVIFSHQQDAEAVQMAAFTSTDPSNRADFDAHWEWMRSSDRHDMRTILVDGEAAGHVGSWLDKGKREVTYWIGREFWGRGVATAALKAYLAEVTERPIYAHAAKDNVGSIRVLEKSGFVITGEGKWYAAARRKEIDEVMMRLDE